MDENNRQIQAQGSVCSDSNGEDTGKNDDAIVPDRRICLVGSLARDYRLHTIAELFNVPVVTSSNGLEYVDDTTCSTYYIIDNFQGEIFSGLCKSRQTILGPPALEQLALEKKKELPDNTRPLYNVAMRGVVVCFTGFRNKDELTKLVPLIHHMGGSIRKDMTAKVTHLIANSCGGEKYQYASTFKVPVLNLQWVHDSWNRHRNDVNFTASQDSFMNQYKLKPFHGARVCFLGFSDDEEKHMTEVLLANGGTVTTIDDPNCTHVVVDESQVGERPDVTSHRAHIVKAEWFWISVQKECSQEEKEYLFEDYIEQVASPGVRRESHAATPSSASRRKRKRMMVHETIQSLVQQTQSPALHKRRSSVSDAGLLSVSNSFLDCTASPVSTTPVGKGRRQSVKVDKNAAFTTDGSELSIEPPPKSKSSRHLVFLELVDTETNYVGILHTIMTLFKDHLETMPEEEALLNNTELNLIFGKLPPIYEVHMKMLDELRWLRAHWTEELCTGDVITKYSTELQKAYPPFINFFEEAKAVLQRCDATKPRFHAFLKAMQTRPECGKLDLSDLMCSPSMRLGKVNILLKEILKYTPKTNPDHVALEKALESLKEVCTYINEDKRKADGQMTLFNIFNEIDNCPPDLVSSLRHYVIKADVIQLSSSEGLASKGSGLVLYVFSDRVEVCKKKSKVFNSAKSPASGIKPNNVKPYKHVRMVPLNTIKRVIDIKETEDCQNVFSLVCKSNEETKEKLYSFAFIVPDESESSTKPLTKVGFLKALTRAMADNLCSADAEKFMAYLEPQQLDIDTSDLSNGTLSKAFKFAKTRLKVGRTFSFNKSTPSKLKRAVSSMMSPFGSSTNLTPASQLANMRLASYSNINELGSQTENSDESPPVAPMSVQPTRKVKASSLGVNALKRL
ncbi:protein ECT2 isoform X4 [Anthonomus grandis grandis]|uniref:protein ECT2 isoform X4 n=1 Tax=Anthonomus grandis grandis TaxID=2921223 RepID=UPI0021667FAA|nr:protein ECT2 isoform X4 [Anthonomus grandis grandis]